MNEHKKKALLSTVFLTVVLFSIFFLHQDRFNARTNQDVAAFKQSAATAHMTEAQIAAIEQLTLQNEQNVTAYIYSLISIFIILIAISFYQLTLHHYRLKDK